MAAEVTVARETRVNPLNAIRAGGGAKEDSLEDKVSWVSKQDKFETFGNSRDSYELLYDEPIIYGDLERADVYLTIQETQKEIRQLRERIKTLPPDPERLAAPKPRLAAQRKLREAIGLLKEYKSRVETRGEGARSVARLKRNGFTMKDIQSFRT